MKHCSETVLFISISKQHDHDTSQLSPLLQRPRLCGAACALSFLSYFECGPNKEAVTTQVLRLEASVYASSPGVMCARLRSLSVAACLVVIALTQLPSLGEAKSAQVQNPDFSIPKPRFSEGIGNAELSFTVTSGFSPADFFTIHFPSNFFQREPNLIRTGQVLL